jgi:ABC-type Co2+ transport system permease subunit
MSVDIGITASDLLQANVTLVTGVLIFLTIAPFSQQLKRRIEERRRTLWLTYATLTCLMLSMLNLVIPEVPFPPSSDYLSAALNMLLLGVVCITATVISIMSSIPVKETPQAEDK